MKGYLSINCLAIASQSLRDGLDVLQKRILTRVRTISFLAPEMRDWLLRHSSTSGLQCSGMTEVDAPHDTVELVSLRDERDRSGVTGKDTEGDTVGCDYKVDVVGFCFCIIAYQHVQIAMYTCVAIPGSWTKYFSRVLLTESFLIDHFP